MTTVEGLAEETPIHDRWCSSSANDRLEDWQRLGSCAGSTARTTQARAVRTREAIVSVAAQHFDTEGYGASSINTILATGAFTKGAIYFHFPSKEAIVGRLIADWNRTVNESISEAIATGPSTTAGEKLAASFTALAHQVAENTNLRAGMKLALEPTIDSGTAFAHWVDAISHIIETAITDGELTDTPTTHRLAWNLCAGTIGAANASATLREDIDLATRIEADQKDRFCEHHRIRPRVHSRI